MFSLLFLCIDRFHNQSIVVGKLSISKENLSIPLRGPASYSLVLLVIFFLIIEIKNLQSLCLHKHPESKLQIIHDSIKQLLKKFLFYATVDSEYCDCCKN